MNCSRCALVLTLMLGLNGVIAFRVNKRRGRQEKLNTKGSADPLPGTASSFAAVEGRTELTSGLEAKEGHLLGKRFVLERFIESRSSSRVLGVPGEVFPDIEGFTDPAHLGQGRWGDVWEAFDTQLKKRVAVKIYYRTVNGQKQYLTWNSASEAGKTELEASIEECTLVQNMLKHRDLFPVGASRICECYEEHISKYRDTDEVTFIVLELCGRTLEDIREDLKPLDVTARMTKARELTKQTLEALQFINMLDPPLIHHDLKLDNVVAVEEGTEFNVKLIDFGCFVWGRPENQNIASHGASYYLPPEFKKTGRRPVAFQLPAYSFDMYSLGVMHMELSCPTMSGRYFWRDHPSWEGEGCPGLPDSDLEFIKASTSYDNTQRPSPADALSGAMFN